MGWLSFNVNDNCSGHKNICEFLSTLPPQYPISEIIVDGVTESVNFFIVLNNTTNLAYFSGLDGGLIIVDCRKISQVLVPGA